MTKVPTEVPEPATEVVAATTRRMLNILRHERTAQRVGQYFDPTTDYAGALFDTYQPTGPNQIEPADLVALTTLSVTMKPLGLRELEERAEDLAGWLKRCGDPALHLAQADDNVMLAMYEAQVILLSLDQVGSTKATKLLARKRPHLVPIYDSYVGFAYGRKRKDGVVRADGIPNWHWWATYRACLRTQEVAYAINSVREAAGVKSPDARLVSDLRILDVATWRAIGSDVDPDG